MIKALFCMIALLSVGFKQRRELALENLVLRQQLAVLNPNHKRLRLRRTDRLFWVWISRIWKRWRESLIVVRPETVVRWHRKGFALYWTWLSRRNPIGRPGISREIRELIRKMVEANPCRRVVHFNVTEHPTALWTAEQMIQAFPDGTAPRFLVRDRDQMYGEEFRERVKAVGIEEILTAPRSPWQNPYAERMIGTLRRDCLDHVVVLGEFHLRIILKRYLSYYHRARTHLALGKDAPEPRPVQTPEYGHVIEIPEVGGLHHLYERRAA